MSQSIQQVGRPAIAVLCAALLLPTGGFVMAQDAPPPPDQQQVQQQDQQGQAPAQAAPALAPEQVDSLVAPVALYPDPLLSQVLVASTYPLEIVEAAQWLQQNGNLQGQDLITAAQQQNWDPSIQALVPFPDVIRRMAQDVRWVTDLGNAFLAQQADVMNAVQRMREKARAAGKLESNSQQTVTTQDQDGQQAIDIAPANPQVVYVPEYNPAYIWGDPFYPYPSIFYPGIGFGYGFGAGISLGFFFGGCCGWGGWGWGPNWFGHSIYVNNSFFHRYAFNDFHDGRFTAGRTAWAHDPGHRLGVPYPNRGLAQQFHGAAGVRGGEQGFRGGASSFAGRGADSFRARGAAGQERFNGAAQAGRGVENRQQFSEPSERLGNRNIPQRSFQQSHSAFGPVENGSRARVQSDHGFSSMGSGGARGGFGGGGAARGGGGGSRGGGGGRR